MFLSNERYSYIFHMIINTIEEFLLVYQIARLIFLVKYIHNKQTLSLTQAQDSHIPTHTHTPHSHIYHHTNTHTHPTFTHTHTHTPGSARVSTRTPLSAPHWSWHKTLSSTHRQCTHCLSTTICARRLCIWRVSEVVHAL